jgi:hypothetical protein
MFFFGNKTWLSTPNLISDAFWDVKVWERQSEGFVAWLTTLKLTSNRISGACCLYQGSTQDCFYNPEISGTTFSLKFTMMMLFWKVHKLLDLESTMHGSCFKLKKALRKTTNQENWINRMLPGVLKGNCYTSRLRKSLNIGTLIQHLIWSEENKAWRVLRWKKMFLYWFFLTQSRIFLTFLNFLACIEISDSRFEKKEIESYKAAHFHTLYSPSLLGSHQPKKNQLRPGTGLDYYRID